jgi:hypothetical protein
MRRWWFAGRGEAPSTRLREGSDETGNRRVAVCTRYPRAVAPGVRAGPEGREQEGLVGVRSGQLFGIRKGIPLLPNQSKVSGFNLKYQRLYNRVAGVYDGSIRLVANLVGGGEAGFRGQYLQELELEEGDRVLEVSIRTGANLRYLPTLGPSTGWTSPGECCGDVKTIWTAGSGMRS